MEKLKRHHLNVVGPFYVVDGCCTACGVPEWIAPELFGEGDDVHCYVKRQPQSPEEVDAMVKVMAHQDLRCVRYAGDDEALLRRLAENGEAGECDVVPPRDAVPLRRDHVVFSARSGTGPWTARAILERLVAFAAKWRTTAIFDDGTVATVSVAWFQDDYHRVDVLASHHPGEWVVQHRGPVLLGDTLHDWLSQDEIVEAVRWQTAVQWAADGPSRPKPW